MNFKIDKDQFNQKFDHIYKYLEPLINQLLTPDSKFTIIGKSKNSGYLIKFLDDALNQFVLKSKNVSLEFPSYSHELNDEINKFKENGDKFKKSSVEFVQDPLNSKNRFTMGNNAKPVLIYTARILALFDMIDQNSLVLVVTEMIKSVKKMKTTVTEREFNEEFKLYGAKLKEFLNVSQNVIENMKNSKEKNLFISARALLSKQSLFLYSSSKAFIKHPKNEPAKLLKDQVYQQTLDALELVESILKNKCKSIDENKMNNLINQLVTLENQVNGLTPVTGREVTSKINIQTQLDDAIKNINKLTTQSIFDSNKKDLLLNECNSVRLALQNLFKAYENNRKSNNFDEIDQNKFEFSKKNRSIRREIRKAIIEQYGLITNKPLDDLIETAKSGDTKNLGDRIQQFELYATRLIEASILACSISSNKEGSQLVELAVSRLKTLLPLVITSSKVLCSNPNSVEANRNMELFRNEWLNQIKILGLSVDDVICLNDFMAVSEQQILEDINKCIIALNSLNAVELKLNSEKVGLRTNRVCDLVLMEIFNFERCDFTERVNEHVKIIRDKILVGFSQSAGYACDAMRAKPMKDLNENEFIDSSRLLYDSIRDLRNALLQIPQDESSNLLDETEVKEEVTEPEVELDEEIHEKLVSFNEEKSNFDREVLKWDDRSNDIIVLSKQMCVLMMDMTNFTTGRGPFTSIADIIQAAKKISEIGSRLEKLCRDLSNECPESESKKELNRHLNMMPLFCNQLNIGSKVKENIIDPESVSSLLISSKNLMNTVASVVKTSYLASTKYTSKTSTKKPIVQWKMKPPELKPLVPKATQFETTGLIRKASKRNIIAPFKLLSEFDV